MRLRFAIGDFNQIAVAELRRSFQYRVGNCDVVVPRKSAQHLGRRVVDRRETVAKLGPRPRFDPLDQVSEDFIEDIDLLITEPIRIGNKEVGDTPQSVDAPIF
jgi:hypothetical protein